MRATYLREYRGRGRRGAVGVARSDDIVIVVMRRTSTTAEVETPTTTATKPRDMTTTTTREAGEMRTSLDEGATRDAFEPGPELASIRARAFVGNGRRHALLPEGAGDGPVGSGGAGRCGWP